MLRRLLFAFAAGALFAALVAVALRRGGDEPPAPGKMAGEVLREELLGYTRYRDYLGHGKEALRGQTRLLAATVTRSEVYTRHVRQKKFVFSFDALVTIYYVAEYSYGYELAPDKYAIRDTEAGIEIQLERPIMVTTPAIRSRSHDTPSRSWLIDEEKAIVDLYEGMDNIILQQGLSIARDAGVVALCEKQIIEFFRGFLARQPGVKRVPHIYVTYRN